MSHNGYPIMLNLQDKQVVVIGGGIVATRKVTHLLSAGARVLVISPELTTELMTCVETEQIEWIQDTYQRDMMNPFMPVLVITTTDNARVNQTVAQDANRIRAWVNVTDGESVDSDFSNMVVIEQPPITIAISTNGTSPTLLRHIKSILGESLGNEFSILADWLGEIRPALKTTIDDQLKRRDIYQEILESDVLSLLKENQHEKARQRFQQIITERLPQ